jgi:phosphoglucomutase
MDLSPLAGKPAPLSMLVNVARLVTAYYAERPDPAEPSQRVAFGTSGHRGSSVRCSFNEAHIVATTQAICDYRKQAGTSGPLFLGMDTHALSEAAFATALEMLAANGVEVMIDRETGYTPTPAVSHAILTHNRARPAALADGIVITPSHNPPEDGGFKYNPPHGGPADTQVTKVVQERANTLLASGIDKLRRVPYRQALVAASTHRHDYIGAYVGDLGAVVDLDAVRASGLRLGVDAMGGAGLGYWRHVAERYGLQMQIQNDIPDGTFRFMTVDWDGKIRMDCSSPYAMAGLIALKDRFDIAFGNDTDTDRHGIVTRSAGLLNPNAYLAVAMSYLVAHRPGWPAGGAVGKTAVSSSLIDRVGSNWAASDRDASRLQVVRGRIARWLAAIRWRGERGRFVPAPRRQGLDHRQGRHHPGPARSGDDGNNWPRPRRDLPRLDSRMRRPALRTHGRAGESATEGRVGPAVSRTTRHRRAGRRPGASGARRRARQRRRAGGLEGRHR